jgi:hypothetical protein
MIAISLAFLGVIVSDQTLKLVLRRYMGTAVASLGPFGQIRIVGGRLWARRVCGPSRRFAIWSLWTAAAVALVPASRWIPSSAPFVGLVLGGSLSNALENTRRGSVSDYVCLRFWPAFNLADLALVVGAIGTLAQLLIVIFGAT